MLTGPPEVDEGLGHQHTPAPPAVAVLHLRQPPGERGALVLAGEEQSRGVAPHYVLKLRQYNILHFFIFQYIYRKKNFLKKKYVYIFFLNIYI